MPRARRLPARQVIHTVGPVWQGGTRDEAALLASRFRRCIEVAANAEVGSMAFRAISTGVYGYPKALAADVAVTTVRAEAARFPTLREIIFCCFSSADLALYAARLQV